MDAPVKEKHVEDRRKFSRLNLAVDINYSLVQKEKPLEVEVQSKNLSAGGICLIVYEKLNIGDSLALAINLPDGDNPIQVKGTVKWIGDFILSVNNKYNKHSWDVGVEFTEINEADREKLSKYVFRLMKPLS